MVPTPVFLPGEFHQQRSLANYSLWSPKELGTTEQHTLSLSLSLSLYVLAAQSGLTLCNPMDCGLPGSSVHEILQARILEWVASSCSYTYYICS